MLTDERRKTHRDAQKRSARFSSALSHPRRNFSARSENPSVPGGAPGDCEVRRAFGEHLGRLHTRPPLAIQAIALFGAIAAAIAGPLFVAYRERKHRAKAIGEYVAADYFGFRMHVVTLLERIRSGGFEESSPTRPVEAMIEELRLELPATFVEALRLAIDADIKRLRPCTDMIGAAIVHNNYVEQFGASTAPQNEWWPKNLRALEVSLKDSQ